MIYCHDCWPWTKPGYITMTRRQSNNQWCCSIAVKTARFQKFQCAIIRRKSFPLSFLRSRRHSTRWLSFKGPNFHRRVLPISAGAIGGQFEGKTPREFHQVGLVLARHCPRSTGTCILEDTGLPGLPVSWSLILFSGSCLVGIPPIPWTEKNN
jgi:hypothetical protein